MSKTILLITDTNIWIDLDHGDLIDQIFKLPYSVCTSDFARNEIQSVDVNELERKGLSFLSMDAKLVNELMLLRATKNAIGIADMAGFILARETNSVLVTGDKHLVRFSREKQVQVHGLLWLMDEMIVKGILSGSEAAYKLKIILDRGSRLPMDECLKRFDMWKWNSVSPLP